MKIQPVPQASLDHRRVRLGGYAKPVVAPPSKELQPKVRLGGYRKTH